MATSDERREEEEKKKEKMNWYEGVPVPVDADGNVVPLTTTVMYDDNGAELAASRFEFKNCGSNKGWTAFCAQVNFGPQPYGLQELHLHRPDSWEKLADDLARYEENKVTCEYFGMTLGGTCDGCRGRNRRLSCIAAALDDVARRVRAIREAERNED